MQDGVERTTLGEIVQRNKAMPRSERCKYHTPRKAWLGGHTWHSALEAAEKGDMSIAATATQAVDRVQASGINFNPMRRPDRVVAGGTRVSVPDYLGNSPRCMLRRTRQATSTRHVNLYVSICMSAGISASQGLARGCAVLGLLECLQSMQVGVDLFLVCESGEVYGPKQNLVYVLEVESRPLDLSTAGFAIAHPAFLRTVMFNVLHNEWNWSGQWAAAKVADDSGGKMRQLLCLPPEDVYITGSLIRSFTAAGEAERWIEAQLTQILALPA